MWWRQRVGGSTLGFFLLKASFIYHRAGSPEGHSSRCSVTCLLTVTNHIVFTEALRSAQEQISHSTLLCFRLVVFLQPLSSQLINIQPREVTKLARLEHVIASKISLQSAWRCPHHSAAGIS